VIFFPATLETGVMQERVASPLMCTVQAPQSAMPQPNFVPVMFSVFTQHPEERHLRININGRGFSIQP